MIDEYDAVELAYIRSIDAATDSDLALELMVGLNQYRTLFKKQEVR